MIAAPMWSGRTTTMHLLQAVSKHRPVDQIKQLPVDLHLEVRGDAKQVLVERRMVDLAQAEPVLRHRLAEFVSVAHDVRGISQVPDRQSADGALSGIRVDHASAELRLVQPLLYDALRVPPLSRARVERI